MKEINRHYLLNLYRIGKKFELKVIDHRIPDLNDMFINKNEKIQMCKKTNYSRLAQFRPIVKFVKNLNPNG